METKGWICRGLKYGLPQISWRSGNSKGAEMAASELSQVIGRRQGPREWGEVGTVEERDMSCWSQCQRGQDSL